MTSFNLTPQVFTSPVGGKPPRISFKTSLSPSQGTNTNTNNPIHPATYLQVSYRVGGQEIFSDILTPRDVQCDDAEAGLYSVSPGSVPLVRVPAWTLQEQGGEQQQESIAGEVVLHAWRKNKLLDMWTVGRIEGMGVVV